MKNQIKHEDAPAYTAAKSEAYDDDAIIKLAISILEDRLKTEQSERGDAMTNPDAVKTFLKFNLVRLEHEEFAVMFLDNQHRLIKYESMFRGTIDGASVYSREVAKRALQLNAAAVIFAHNHPSGVSVPSHADKMITSKLKEALNLFDIRTLDHFIVGDSIFSFAEGGLI